VAKSKWDSVKDKLILVEAWARDGLTDCQIAKNLGISESTLNKYKLDHSEFLQSLKKGKEVVDIEVENSLLKRAKGYAYKEQTFEKVWNADLGKYITVNTKTVTKEVQPDTTAQIFWLKNRKPVQWRDRPAEQLPNSDTEDDNLFTAIEQAVKHDI